MASAVSLTGSTASRPDALPSLNHAKITPLREEVRGTGKSKPERLQFKYRRPGRIINFLLQSTSSHQSWEISPVRENLPPEHLKVATYIGGRKVSLTFSDGFFSTVDLAHLGINTAKFRLDTVRASWGSAVEVEDTEGKTIHIDSAVLRAMCDPEYAVGLEQAIVALGANESSGKGPPSSGMAQRVRHLSAAKQRRLDILMDKNNEGRLGAAERREFQALVREVEQLTIDNARRLAELK